MFLLKNKFIIAPCRKAPGSPGLELSLNYPARGAKHETMRLSESQAKQTDALMTALSALDPRFWNYKDGVIAVRITGDAPQVPGFTMVSCNPHFDRYIAKYRPA